LVGDPEKEEDFLKERSPITYADKIKSTVNLLIIQGANGPRVVKNESDQIVERLRSKGIGVEYMVFDDEGHGLTKYSNLIKALKKSAEFLANSLSSQTTIKQFHQLQTISTHKFTPLQNRIFYSTRG
jgi:dipeptidyl aminopeptidase/acylaminoacyl peptidase